MDYGIGCRGRRPVNDLGRRIHGPQSRSIPQQRRLDRHGRHIHNHTVSTTSGAARIPSSVSVDYNFSNNEDRTVYTGSGTTKRFSYVDAEKGSDVGTLEYTVKNPMSYVLGSADNDYDWLYTSHDDNLWSSGAEEHLRSLPARLAHPRRQCLRRYGHLDQSEDPIGAGRHTRHVRVALGRHRHRHQDIYAGSRTPQFRERQARPMSTTTDMRTPPCRGSDTIGPQA